MKSKVMSYELDMKSTFSHMNYLRTFVCDWTYIGTPKSRNIKRSQQVK